MPCEKKILRRPVAGGAMRFLCKPFHMPIRGVLARCVVYSSQRKRPSVTGQILPYVE